jgi:hypothetical protein
MSSSDFLDEASKMNSPTTPSWPPMANINGRWYVTRNDFNRYKAELLASALGAEPAYPPADDHNPLIPLKQVAAELGVGRRTIGTRMAEAAKAVLTRVDKPELAANAA